jgi:hypothetical protein
MMLLPSIIFESLGAEASAEATRPTRMRDSNVAAM